MQSYPFSDSKPHIVSAIEAWTQKYTLSYQSDFLDPEKCFKKQKR